ncbi:hypothetical protein BP5796_09949 [Coleophoma crateriformis]|uniref:Life-span regulatory factor domain-containing protein n=1 Tax=Coleophoma crateriformis TaxID=565419 RepID=A0A3D8QU05_9HELO|nr:hypothetical protein BP5796_09949 [Coleophoma crateriformis]
MAQSARPPPVRSNSTAGLAAAPLSPRAPSDKKHHARRKSGKEGSTMSERKHSTTHVHTHRPATLTRRTTPGHIHKISPAKKQHKEEEEERRDSGESFPQFCMSCEKQFVPLNNTFLYCSESCRRDDAAFAPPARTNSYPTSVSSISPTTPYFAPYSPTEGPDIIPRASPTQSRPKSYFDSDSCTRSYSFHGSAITYQSEFDANTSYHKRSSTTALASLRELATALPKTTQPSDRDRTSPPISRSSSGVWNYISIPFTKPTPNLTPQNSLNEKRYNGGVSTSYGGLSGSGSNKSREDLSFGGFGPKSYHGSSAAVNGYVTSANGMGMDRPLPPRSGPSGYGHRSKSIDLVTPFVTGQ